MMTTEMPGSGKRGRPHRRFVDVVKEVMMRVSVTKEDRVRWRQMLCSDKN